MPSISPGITKNPPCGHLVFILFMYFLKKASALRRQNAPTVPHITSSHVQWFVRSIRFIRFAYFAALPFIRVCLSLTRQSPLHSPGTSCHARFAHTHSLTHSFRSSVHSCLPVAYAPVTATLAWHFVPCSLRLHSFTSSLNSFASLLRSLTHSTHFHVRPLSHASRICQGSLLAISTIRVASRVRDK
jgi:hypothetical protein